MTGSVHSKAKIGFQKAVEAYERGRPEYPSGAIDFILTQLKINTSSVVLDVGAGTGKFTKLLQRSGAHIMAVEPVAGMRERFQTLFPEIEVLDCTAEKIPLGDASVDVVVAAQAFHWFDGPQALKEFHRILKPNGRLGLIWNARDESLSWVAELSRIIDPYEGTAPRYKSMKWRQAFGDQNFFSELGYRRFSNIQLGSEEMVLDRVSSISFISALSTAEKAEVLGQVRELIQGYLAMMQTSTVELPYRTDVYWCEKI